MHGPGNKRSAAASVTATKDRTIVKDAKNPEAEAAEADVPTRPKKIVRVYIRLVDSQNQELLMKLKKTIDVARGDTDVILVLGPASSKQIIKLPLGLDNTEANIAQLSAIVGAENIKVQ
jgi:hypothetical protein